MMFGTDPLDAHTAAVLAIGIEPPPEWTALQARLADFLTAPSSIPQRLADAVINGTDDVAALCAMALAEASALPPSHATVDAAVKHAVLQRLRDIYQPHAPANYQSVAAQFDALATKFANAASVVDPEESAERLVHAPDKLRKAWSDAERYAHQVTETMTALTAAASLAGTNTDRDETDRGHDRHSSPAGVGSLVGGRSYTPESWVIGTRESPGRSRSPRRRRPDPPNKDLRRGIGRSPGNSSRS